MYKQRGISLVELMVSITVGLVLMAGVVQLFLSSKLTFTTQQAMSRVQETGRLAMEFMSEDIRVAGHMGCLNVALSGPNNKVFRNFLKEEAALAYDYEVAVDGKDASEVKDGYPTEPRGGVLAGTDALLIRSASGRNVGIARKNDPTQLFIENTGVEMGDCDNGTNRFSGLCAGDILAVADCGSVRVFQATGFTGNAASAEIGVQHTDTGPFKPGNRVATWGAEDIDERQTFGKDAQILTIQNLFYYIGNNRANNPSLFRRVNNDRPQELLQGVEDMQLTYGLDTNDDRAPDTYRPADQIAANEWGGVSSVRLELLVASTEDNVLQEPQGYTFNGVPVNDPGDRRLRQVFSTTVAIRGLLP